VSSQESQRPRWSRWTEAFSFAFIIALWLVGSVIAFAVKWPVGIAWFCVGSLYVGGQVWFDKHGDEHPTLTLVWVAGQRAITGIVLIVVGVIYWSWGSIFMFAFGAWSLALAAVFTLAIRHNRNLDLSDSSTST
jgi:hypothetical protein